MIIEIPLRKLIDNGHPSSKGTIVEGHRLFDRCWEKLTWYAYPLGPIGYIQSRIHLLIKLFSLQKCRLYCLLNKIGWMETTEGCYMRLFDLKLIRWVKHQKEKELEHKLIYTTEERNFYKQENEYIRQSIAKFIDSFRKGEI